MASHRLTPRLVVLITPALWLCWRPSFVGTCSPQARCLRSRSDFNALIRACSNAIVEKWQEEAQQWEFGRIPDMIPPGQQYDPDLRSYYEGEDFYTFDPRPFQVFTDEDRASRSDSFPFENQEQESDYELALRHFDRWDSEPQSTGVVLDLGCGSALMARRFAQSKHFETVYALDILWAPLEAARASAEAEKTGPADGLWLLRGDAQSLPFKEKQLDFVWWGLGIHKVQDAEETLRSVRTSLRPGGRLIATTRTFLFLPFELRSMSTAAGFTNVSVECVGEGTMAERLVLRASAPEEKIS